MPDRSDAVTFAYLHEDDDAHSWTHSMLELLLWDMTHDGRIIAGGPISMKPSTGDLVRGRNDVVAQFLADGKADWLWWVDNDMGFAPDTVDRLLEAADPVERPIVGGLCFAWRDTGSDGMGGHHNVPRPTIFDWVKDHPLKPGWEGHMGRARYPINAVVQCAGTGSACILIHRSVFERIVKEFGTCYDRVPGPDGELMPEDLSFCVRASALGVPIFVHTGVKTSHKKTIWVSEQDHWRTIVAPPAEGRTAVLVPVLRRPGNAAPFMRSLRASTGLATAYAICEPTDTATIDAWRAAGAKVFVDHDEFGTGWHTFAEKVNGGYRRTTEPWLFLTGDDVRFHPGWLDHAQWMARDECHVVGTNDLSNPRVMDGEKATHLLVRRSYIDEVGSSWDGPGVVAHEGYRHWYVDDEIVTAARQRGVWAMALGSRVEHLHPLFGKGKPDEVYVLGQSSAQEDGERFRRRLAGSMATV